LAVGSQLDRATRIRGRGRTIGENRENREKKREKERKREKKRDAGCDNCFAAIAKQQ
jgi:hypothetical protein